ncbi:MAG: GAF domain-containing protein [Pseudomonadota bacterium]
MADQLKILVAESDQKIAVALTVAFRQRGWETASAGDAIEAFNLALKEIPDAVVLNSQLPDGGGLVTLKKFRCSADLAVIPVIAIGVDSALQKGQLLSAGAQECLEQPADTAAVCAAIQKYVAQPTVIREAPAEKLRDARRMASLVATGLMDSPPSGSFDRITRLAAKLLDVPTALVTLVDQDRQFFKSQTGLPEPWATARQTPLSHSFCQWVVTSKEHLVVSDARRHPLLRDNLAVQQIGVIAYAGIPLSAGENQILGSFCAIDGKPHQWTKYELDTLNDLALITETYMIQGKKRRDGAMSIETGSAATHLIGAGNAIAGATRILNRGEVRLGDAERAALIAIITEQSRLPPPTADGTHRAQ